MFHRCKSATTAGLLALLFTLTVSFPARAEISAASVSTEPAVLGAGQTARIQYIPPPGQTGRSMTVHYGFNGWNLPLNGPGAGSGIEQGNVNFFMDAAMDFDPASGSWSRTITLPAEARALHMAFCRDNCGSGMWDNNQGQDYNRPVGVFPYIGPILTWNDQVTPDRGIVIAFEHPTPGEAWIRFGKPGGRMTRKWLSKSGTMHRFVLTGLVPSTLYRYQVGVGSDYESPTYSFRTGPSATDRAKFVVFGDAQDNGENGNFARLASTIARDNADIDFIISTGDLPWNDKPGDWWSFFDKGRDLFATKVVMPAPGNHDTPGTSSSRDYRSFNKYFAHPGVDRPYYRFRYGNAFFHAMNSEDPPQFQRGGEQYRWLQEQLGASAPEESGIPEWNFTYWHIAPFNAGVRHWRAQYNFRPLTELFAGHIDWHFSGHEHLYQRFAPLTYLGDKEAPVQCDHYGVRQDQGTGFTVVPSGGVWPEDKLVSHSVNEEIRSLLVFPDAPRGTDQVERFFGYSRVDIGGPTMTIRTFRVGELSGLVDSVTITK